jgi:hypothetical protein
MALLAKAQPMTMRWCLDCHRNPAPRLDPPDTLFDDVGPKPAAAHSEPTALMRAYHVQTAHLTNCSTCHH